MPLSKNWRRALTAGGGLLIGGGGAVAGAAAAHRRGKKRQFTVAKLRNNQGQTGYAVGELQHIKDLAKSLAKKDPKGVNRALQNTLLLNKSPARRKVASVLNVEDLPMELVKQAANNSSKDVAIRSLMAGGPGVIDPLRALRGMQAAAKKGEQSESVSQLRKNLNKARMGAAAKGALISAVGALSREDPDEETTWTDRLKRESLPAGLTISEEMERATEDEVNDFIEGALLGNKIKKDLAITALKSGKPDVRDLGRALEYLEQDTNPFAKKLREDVSKSRWTGAGIGGASLGVPSGLIGAALGGSAKTKALGAALGLLGGGGIGALAGRSIGGRRKYNKGILEALQKESAAPAYFKTGPLTSLNKDELEQEMVRRGLKGMLTGGAIGGLGGGGLGALTGILTASKGGGWKQKALRGSIGGLIGGLGAVGGGALGTHLSKKKMKSQYKKEVDAIKDLISSAAQEGVSYAPIVGEKGGVRGMVARRLLGLGDGPMGGRFRASEGGRGLGQAEKERVLGKGQGGNRGAGECTDARTKYLNALKKKSAASPKAVSRLSPLAKGLLGGGAGAGLLAGGAGLGSLLERQNRFSVMSTPLGVVAGQKDDLDDLSKAIKKRDKQTFGKALSRVVPVDRRYASALVNKQRQLDVRKALQKRSAAAPFSIGRLLGGKGLAALGGLGVLGGTAYLGGKALDTIGTIGKAQTAMPQITPTNRMRFGSYGG